MTARAPIGLDELPSSAATSFIYQISAGEFQKVGVALNPLKRLAAHQTSNGHPLHLVATWSVPSRDAIGLETKCHKALDRWKARGEWFRCPTNIATYIIDGVLLTSDEDAAWARDVLRLFCPADLWELHISTEGVRFVDGWYEGEKLQVDLLRRNRERGLRYFVDPHEEAARFLAAAKKRLRPPRPSIFRRRGE